VCRKYIQVFIRGAVGNLLAIQENSYCLGTSPTRSVRTPGLRKTTGSASAAASDQTTSVCPEAHSFMPGGNAASSFGPGPAPSNTVSSPMAAGFKLWPFIDRAAPRPASSVEPGSKRIRRWCRILILAPGRVFALPTEHGLSYCSHKHQHIKKSGSALRGLYYVVNNS
jgi:hypothetical protein